MAIISRDVLRRVNENRDSEDSVYTFTCDNGQEFHILTSEQLNLLLNHKKQRAK